MEIMQEISSLIRAKYPLIYINSQEETRVINLLKTITDLVGLNTVEWSFASGLVGQEIREEKMHAGDPVSAIDHYKVLDKDTAIVLKDYHAFLKDAEVIRALKDAVNDYRGVYSPIIIVAPIVNIPIELEKETVLVDFPLPDREYIQGVLEDIIDTSGLFIGEEKLNRSIDACTGLTHTEIENIASKSIIIEGTIDPDYILQEKKAIVKKSGILEYVESDETLDKIGGTAKLKHWLRQRQASFNPEAREYGLPIPKGLMLTGVPGCGKSMVCKALSNSWNMPLLKLDVGKVMGSLVGSSEENMRRVIKISESVAPCVLWIDEIEKGLSGTKSSNFSDGGTTARVFSTFLNWLQDKKKPVFVIATANDLTQLPSELLRKGRFDDIFFVDLPDEIERKEIFKLILEKNKRDYSKFDLDYLAASSKGFSGAEIEQSILDSMFETFSTFGGKSDISNVSIIKSLKSMIPLSKTKEDNINKIREEASKVAKSAN